MVDFEICAQVLEGNSKVSVFHHDAIDVGGITSGYTEMFTALEFHSVCLSRAIDNGDTALVANDDGFGFCSNDVDETQSTVLNRRVEDDMRTGLDLERLAINGSHVF